MYNETAYMSANGKWTENERGILMIDGGSNDKDEHNDYIGLYMRVALCKNGSAFTIT